MQKKTKLMFIIPNLGGGGAEKVLITLLKNVDRQRFDTYLCVIELTGAFTSEIPDDVHVINLECSKLRYSFLKLYSIIHHIRPDTIMSTLTYMNTYLGLLIPFFRYKPMIIFREVTTHSVVLNRLSFIKRILHTCLYKFSYQYASFILAQSDGMYEDLVKNFHFKNVIKINNPCEIEAIQQKAKEESELADRKAIKVITAGRLNISKAYDVLIRAFQLVAHERLDVELYILGKGELEESLKKLAFDLDIQEKVHFLGFIKNPYAYIKDADLFVLSSRQEGFPNVLIEAMALGVPVIATDCRSGPREILMEGKYGRLVPVDDSEALAEGILRALDDSKNSSRLIERANHYHVSKIIRQYQNIFENKESGEVFMDKKVSVIGLGYVGLPLAVAFSKHIRITGFDVSESKIALYNQGIDPTNEVGTGGLKEANIFYTSNAEDLKECNFHIIAVPTPVGKSNIPDLEPLAGASRLLGQNLSKNSIVVYESTVYPGVTEEFCVPILERESGLKCGVDFKVGYSPERINPGDKVHTVDKVIKVVSGMDEESCDVIARMYELVVKAGVHKAPSIKVAEAAKVIENSQRDINIAFMNELSIIFNKMGIDTKAVLEAAGTKWNFLKFYPGLVGGHCIGVDPYYLTYRAQELGYQPEVILAGRRINDNMGKYIAENVIKLLIHADVQVKKAKILVLGVTFKENVPDVRNSKVVDIINELKDYGATVLVADPMAQAEDVQQEYGFDLVDYQSLTDLHAVILAVAHEQYQTIDLQLLKAQFGNNQPLLVDAKGLVDKKETEALGFKYWRL